MITLNIDLKSAADHISPLWSTDIDVVNAAWHVVVVYRTGDIGKIIWNIQCLYSSDL